MDVPPVDVADDIRHLQRCIDDLISVLALPAMWIGGEPSRILDVLLDGMLRMLQLDLVYVRLNDTEGQAPAEIARLAQSQQPFASAHELCEVLKGFLGADPQEWPPRVRQPIGDRDISILPLGLGLQGEIGVIAAGSERADF